MKAHITTMTFLAVTGLLACSQTPDATLEAGTGIDDEIHERIETFSNAFVRADTLVLSSLLTDDYIHTNTDGSILGKQAWLTWIQTQYDALQEGRLRIDNYVNDSVEVRIYGGNTAVVTGVNSSQGVREGDAYSSHIRFTHVWVKEGDQWRRAAFHDTRIDP